MRREPPVPLFGLTPLSHRVATRRETRERLQQQAETLANLEAYEWQKERARQWRESDQRMRQLDVEKRRAEDKTQAVYDAGDKRTDSTYGDAMRFLGEAGRQGATPENIADALLDDDDDEDDDGVTISADALGSRFTIKLPTL